MSSIDALFGEVVAVVGEIPRGRVATYGQVAALAGRPGAARWVGRALGALPSESGVPWHRVLAASGRITIGGGDGAQAREQARLLEIEGVAVDERGRVDLRQVGWLP
jgi:methylated-DNA-protein-cysteine methyltransferase-like protein